MISKFAPAVLLLIAACSASGDPRTSAGQGQDPLPDAIPDSTFGRLITEISEPERYFDTDNLISNESSYLHAVSVLEGRTSGGVYIGVGPGQNFSYMAAVRPRIAFIVDIRRDNLLEHLLLKSIFETAPTRIEYLSLLVGSAPPSDAASWRDSSVVALVRYVDERRSGTPPGASAMAAAHVIDSTAARHGAPLTTADSLTIRRFHDRFISDGLDLRFTTHGRAPMWYYPTLRDLLLEVDGNGRQRNYLASAASYERLREMQIRNLVVPVVGDLGGNRALRSIGRLAEGMDEPVSMIYASNVEFYLLQDGSFNDWADNVAALPRDPAGVIVRSYFPGGMGRDHPDRLEGYYSTQVVEPLQSFVETTGGEGYRGWFDIVTRNVISDVAPPVH